MSHPSPAGHQSGTSERGIGAERGIDQSRALERGRAFRAGHQSGASIRAGHWSGAGHSERVINQSGALELSGYESFTCCKTPLVNHPLTPMLPAPEISDAALP